MLWPSDFYYVDAGGKVVKNIALSDANPCSSPGGSSKFIDLPANSSADGAVTLDIPHTARFIGYQSNLSGQDVRIEWRVPEGTLVTATAESTASAPKPTTEAPQSVPTTNPVDKLPNPYPNSIDSEGRATGTGGSELVGALMLRSTSRAPAFTATGLWTTRLSASKADRWRTEMVTILIAVLALLVALVALLRDTREHRRNRTADVQALMFQSNRSGVVTHINGDRGLRKFEPSVHASGFGTRYDVRTYLWVDDQVEPKWKDLSQSADRFDNTSEPLRCEIESTTTIPAECGLASDTTSPRYGGGCSRGTTFAASLYGPISSSRTCRSGSGTG